MKLKHAVALIATTPALFFTAKAVAAHRTGALSFSANTGYTWFSGKQHLKNSAIYGIAVGYDFSSSLSAQLQASRFYTKKASRAGGSKTAGGIYTANGIYHFLAGRRFEPLILAGIGVMRINHPSNNDPATLMHLSAGVGGELFLGNSVSLSMSGRDHYTFSGGKSDYSVNAGLNFYLFGKNALPDENVTYGKLPVPPENLATTTVSAPTPVSTAPAKTAAGHSTVFLKLSK